MSSSFFNRKRDKREEGRRVSGHLMISSLFLRVLPLILLSQGFTPDFHLERFSYDTVVAVLSTTTIISYFACEDSETR